LNKRNKLIIATILIIFQLFLFSLIGIGGFKISLDPMSLFEYWFYIFFITVWGYYSLILVGQAWKKHLDHDKKGCYHKWRYYNRWCEACGGFTHGKAKCGVIVHQCYKCGLMWDEENGDWTQENINNIFFNKYYEGKV
jgi:hypothetical protein